MRDEFLITRQGKQYVLFQGLLDEAHNRGLRGIDTELIQVPDDANGNVAIVKATVEMEGGEAGPRIFSGIGDASPQNVGRSIAPHLIRMAETRAKARALRDAVNVGATALEELSDGDDAPPANSSGGESGGRSYPRAVDQAEPEAPARERSSGGSGRPRNSSSTKDTGETRPQAVDETTTNGRAEEPVEAAPQQGSRRGAQKRGSQKARKSQVDLLRTLAEELRGENGVSRLEGRIGKSLSDLTRAEADEWIDRLTPEDRE
ncbi:MAG: hypothetical protein ACR2HO_05145 [Rubrobacteraceae bacterium]